MPKIVFWLLGISLHLVKKSECFTPMQHHPSSSLVGKLGGGRTLVLLMSLSRTQSPERNLRSVLEGTRVDLEQAGTSPLLLELCLPRHWCMAHNIQDHPEILSPWELRFGGKV